MKNSILTLATLALVSVSLAPTSFASVSASGSSNEVVGNKREIAKVRALADRKMNGSDVRKTVRVFDNVDNPCAESGINYIVDVEVLRPEFKEEENGEITQSREWGLINTYWITQAGLRRGEDLSDDRCQE